LFVDVAEEDVQVLLLVFEQRLRCLRHEDLPSVAGGPDPGRTVNGKPGVASLGRHRMAGVQAHPHLDLHVVRPRVGEKRQLPLHGGEERLTRARKSDEEGVALGIYFVAAMGGEGGPEQTLMLAEHLRIALTKLLEKPCRPLDIGEEERDRAARQISHVARA
jgi:hypothetical protein